MWRLWRCRLGVGEPLAGNEAISRNERKSSPYFLKDDPLSLDYTYPQVKYL